MTPVTPRARVEAALRAWREYAEFLNRASGGARTLAHLHGWRCPEADVAEGIRRREELGHLSQVALDAMTPPGAGEARSTAPLRF